MLLNYEKSIKLLSTELQKYIKTPSTFFVMIINQKILPLLGFTFYVYIMPQILTQIIPISLTFFHNYLSIQNQQTLIYIVFLVLGNFLTVVAYSVFMYFVYTKKINMEKYRISPKKPWPWQENAQEFNFLFHKTIKTLITNNLLFGSVILLIWASIFQRKVHFSHDLPSFLTILWQLLLFLGIQDTTSTFTHTLLHSPQLYWIHKKHHEYTTTISIAAEYAHPIEFIISNSLPTVIGFKFLAYFYPVHVVSAVTWLIFRILLTSDLHSGYEFPWDFYKILPFTAPASYHDYHHSHNVGNFASSFMLIEALNGNNQEYFKYLKEKKQ